MLLQLIPRTTCYEMLALTHRKPIDPSCNPFVQLPLDGPSKNAVQNWIVGMNYWSCYVSNGLCAYYVSWNGEKQTKSNFLC